MAIIKSALEKALEKVAEIGELTPEEKESLKGQEKLQTVLATFYKGELKKDELWQQLQGVSLRLLKEAQLTMISSLRLGSNAEMVKQKRDGIMAIESSKGKPNIPAVENYLNSIEKLQKEYNQQKEAFAQRIREAVEHNPHMRMRQVRTQDGRIVQTAVPVEEAVRTQMADFLDQHEQKYEEKFMMMIERFKMELK
jgi:hypothetical protein